MNRLLVALLAALDAALAAAGGVIAAFAPLTLLWVFAFGTGADAGALWPASAVVWQLGHLVPVAVRLPDEYLASAGIDAGAASFGISLAPLLFATFTAVFAARSGTRAARAGEPLTGAASGAAVFVALAAVIATTGTTPLAAVQPWQAVAFPALVYVVPLAVAAVVGAWIAETGTVGRLRRNVEARGARRAAGWGEVPALIARGAAVASVALVGIGALVAAVAVFARMGQIVALFQAANVDAVGVVVLSVAQFAYLPTLVVWGLSFAAGPGFALGVDTAVSPSGTQLGVIPGLPILGAVPESTTPWLLLLALLPIAAGALAGWVLRSRFAAQHPLHEAYGPRVVALVGVTVLTGAFAALLAVLGRGALGPGRLAEVGPEPGPLAAAVGLEVLVGAGILLLSPRRATPAREVAPWTSARASTAAPADEDRARGDFRDLAPLPTLPVHAFSAGADTAPAWPDAPATAPRNEEPGPGLGDASRDGERDGAGAADGAGRTDAAGADAPTGPLPLIPPLDGASDRPRSPWLD